MHSSVHGVRRRARALSLVPRDGCVSPLCLGAPRWGHSGRATLALMGSAHLLGGERPPTMRVWWALLALYLYIALADAVDGDEMISAVAMAATPLLAAAPVLGAAAATGVTEKWMARFMLGYKRNYDSEDRRSSNGREPRPDRWHAERKAKWIYAVDEFAAQGHSNPVATAISHIDGARPTKLVRGKNKGDMISVQNPYYE